MHGSVNDARFPRARMVTVIVWTAELPQKKIAFIALASAFAMPHELRR
jgi:hypothetical protein